MILSSCGCVDEQHRFTLRTIGPQIAIGRSVTHSISDIWRERKTTADSLLTRGGDTVWLIEAFVHGCSIWAYFRVADYFCFDGWGLWNGLMPDFVSASKLEWTLNCLGLNYCLILG